jgi:uncharacterized protein (TIGR03083 family)
MDFLEWIRRESELFYAAAATADPSLGVPSCPDWSIADLVWHLGEVQWFWGTIIELRATDPSQAEAGKPARPADYAELLAWGLAQVDRMTGLLEANPDDVAVWTWALEDADHNVGFIRRHQVQEAAVHRWDLQAAATDGKPDPIAAEPASDSVDEFLAITLPWGVNEKKPLPGSVHLHCTDADGEWLIDPVGRLARAHAKGDVAVRATASDLLLALYNRVRIDDLDVIGDAAIARELVARVDGT